LALAYTHTYALFSLAAQAMFAGGYLMVKVRYRPSALVAGGAIQRALFAFTVIALGWLPWFPVLLRQAAQVADAYWLGPLTVWTIPDICQQMFADPAGWTTDHRNSVVAAGLCAAGLVALLCRAREGDLFLLLSGGLPFALALAISVSRANILQARCFVFAQLFLLAALARLLSAIPRLPERAIAAAAVVACLLSLHLDFVERLTIADQSGIRAASEYIASRRSPGERVVVSDPFLYLPLRYYLGHNTRCSLLLPDRPLLHFEGTAALRGADLIDMRELNAVAEDRIWLVGDFRRRPSGWRNVGQRVFCECYGVRRTITVVQFAVER
jgi:hypothetical protein